jgi:hypothetical protein
MPHCSCDFCAATKRWIARALSVAVLTVTIMGLGSTNVQAATLSGGSTTLSSSVQGDTGVSYDVDVSDVTTSAIKCIAITFSTTVGGSTLPTGMDISSATYDAAASDYVPDVQTWTAATSGATVQITNSTGETPASASARTVQLDGITNSSTTNTTYYTEVNTYNNVNCSASGVDTDGISTFVVVDSVTVSATVHPSLTFTIGSTTCSLGTLAAGATSSCTFSMTAATNGTSGYSISYPASSGTLTSSGSDTIDAIGTTATTASTGTEQFGINLKDNATPNVGSNPSGGTGAAASNYGTADNFAWDGTTGRTIASATGPSALTTYTVSAIANIASTTESGVYNLALDFGIVSNY